MATKDLGRTALERGRTPEFKGRVTKKERSLRTKTRLYLRAVDRENADDMIRPKREHETRHQEDKLNPVWRFLDKLVGRPWNKAYSLIRAKFDERTLAGRHVLRDHLLLEVDPRKSMPDMCFGVGHYFIDRRGILRKRA